MALGLAKQLLYRNSAAADPLEAHLSDSLAMFYTSIGDGKEGVAAFLEKRRRSSPAGPRSCRGSSRADRSASALGGEDRRGAAARIRLSSRETCSWVTPSSAPISRLGAVVEEPQLEDPAGPAA